MSGYEELVIAICKAAISDYTKEICKMLAGKKFSKEEIKNDTEFILYSDFMGMLFTKQERLNLFKRVMKKAEDGYYYHDTKEVWKKF